MTFAIAGAGGRLVSAMDDNTRIVPTEIAVANAAGDVTAVTTAEDGGARWIFASIGGATGGIRAFKVRQETDSLSIEAAWSSRDLASPATPLVINGVLFALSTGSSPVLYALEASTGKELWNSGTAIATPVRGVAPSGGDGQVYVVTPDGTVYAFGIPVER